ncbi:MAG: 2,3,4,5-tetrahydropyridine-2,6-dicarboxylate N-succinyltransferase [Oligoflexia bacterium]|nr:MAG: 2,3,4,5-tetrahydropyridine-2,6-dicarboxylate N-succinyltransferase [Oligoflexia bacterium]
MPKVQISKIYYEIQKNRKIEDLSLEEKQMILNTIERLNNGEIRVAEKIADGWITNAWIKEAILLYFRLMKMTPIQAGDLQFFDKIPLKKWTAAEGVRVVPAALARYGSYIEPGAILMPSYVNIGAYVGAGTMVDTWATVGSCAQIGKNVHLSGGVGIGGVLEPVQASPVIIEDNCFIGSRSIVVEGAILEEGAVLGAGVTITSSTKIIDVSGEKEVIHQGRVPKNSVVIPGTYQKSFPAGQYGVGCALIIGKRKPSTDLKTSLTEALRDFQVSV